MFANRFAASKFAADNGIVNRFAANRFSADRFAANRCPNHKDFRGPTSPVKNAFEMHQKL